MCVTWLFSWIYIEYKNLFIICIKTQSSINEYLIWQSFTHANEDEDLTNTELISSRPLNVTRLNAARWQKDVFTDTSSAGTRSNGWRETVSTWSAQDDACYQLLYCARTVYGIEYKNVVINHWNNHMAGHEYFTINKRKLYFILTCIYH